jgi:hypothetical protein
VIPESLDRISTSLTATALVYSSPSVKNYQSRLWSGPFYNAFPDLNDVAPDGSRSLFPHRAKFHLPFDSVFIPSMQLVAQEGLGSDLLPQLPLAEFLEVMSASDPHRAIAVPVRPEDRFAFRVHSYFELTHKRLASAHLKWLFRSYILATFYTAFERFLLKSDMGITVPLPANPRGSSLQKHWFEILVWFKKIFEDIDEATSLASCLAMLTKEERALYEEQWVSHHEKEGNDFSRYHDSLRRMRDFDEAQSIDDMRFNAEFMCQTGMDWLSLSPMDNSPESRTSGSYMPWPQILMRRPPSAKPSISESIIRLLAFSSVAENKYKSYLLDDQRWRLYVALWAEEIDGVGYIKSSATKPFVELLCDAFARDKKALEWSAGLDIASHFIWTESMRQQLCTGVGLKCPYWSNVQCCGNSDLLLRLWNRCRPSRPEWAKHWERPPCLL